jgi:hypothetical protein
MCRPHRSIVLKAKTISPWFLHPDGMMSFGFASSVAFVYHLL